MNQIKKLFSLSALLTLFACVQNTTILSEKGYDGPTGKVSFDMSAMTRTQIENSRVEIFQGTGSNLGRYIYHVPSFTKFGNTLSMEVRAGKWNMVLVTANQSDLELSQPVISAGATMYNTKMWQTTPVGGLLSSVPEIMTGHIDDQQVTANTDNHGDVSLVRNVARIRIKVKEASGLALGGDHKVTLGNVPTTLSWAGTLLPSRDNPAVGNMAGDFVISTDPADPGNQISNELTFIIPAHKGADYDAANPTDITTKKLTLSIDMKTGDGGRYQKSLVEVPVAPMLNKTLELSLIVGAQLTVDATILDWVEEDVDADISTQTSIEVSKTVIDLVGDTSSTVFVKASDNYVVTQDPWIRTASLPNGNIQISTDADSYTAPRSGYVYVTANNLTKKILVNQKAGTGTISVSSNLFWLSPTTGNSTRTITVNSSDPWKLVPPPIETALINRTNATAGSSLVTFTRKTHTGVIQIADYANYYGNSVFTFRNQKSLETVAVTVQNLFFEFDQLNVLNNFSGTNTTVNTDVVRCFGGSGGFTYENAPSWLSSIVIDPVTHSITLSAPGEPNGERREGTIIFRHNEDPTYYYTGHVVQDFLITIPAFNYFVIQYDWPQLRNSTDSDADVKVQFEGNGMPYDGTSTFSRNWVGYSTYTMSYNSKVLLQWGSDARNGQGETVFFNAPMFEVENDALSPRFIKLVAAAYWYDSTISAGRTNPIRTTIFAYKGGTMVLIDTNYRNRGGELLYTDSKQQQVTAVGSSSITNPTRLVEIIYDRIKHSAEIRYVATELNTPYIPIPSGSITRSMMAPEPYTMTDAEKAAAEKKATETLKEQQIY